MIVRPVGGGECRRLIVWNIKQTQPPAHARLEIGFQLAERNLAITVARKATEQRTRRQFASGPRAAVGPSKAGGQECQGVEGRNCVFSICALQTRFRNPASTFNKEISRRAQRSVLKPDKFDGLPDPR
jgi:hypothetical protein